MSIFGDLKGDNLVEQALKAALVGWLPTYLTEVARQEAAGDVAMPASYQTVRESVSRWNEQAMPAIVIEVGGTISVSRKGSKYRAVYGCNVAAVVGGPTRDATRRIAGVYALAISAALTQHGDLAGFADGCEWTDTDYSLIDEARSRTLIAAVVSFDVAVNDVLDVSAGPAGPPPATDDPPIPGLPDYGQVEDVIIDGVTATIGAP